MTRPRTLAAACCAIAATVSLGTPAQAENLEALFPERSQAELDYLDAHRCVVEKLGAATAGNNYVLSGYNAKEGNRAPTDSELQAATSRLETACNPPAPVVYEEPAPTTEPTVYSSGVGNSTVMCESGGDYSINTGNGYYGGWQFDSSTWDAYGDPAYGEANEAPPAVQDQAAASVPYDAWPNC